MFGGFHVVEHSHFHSYNSSHQDWLNQSCILFGRGELAGGVRQVFVTSWVVASPLGTVQEGVGRKNISSVEDKAVQKFLINLSRLIALGTSISKYARLLLSGT